MLPALAKLAGVPLQTVDDHSDGGGNSASSSSSRSDGGHSSSPSRTSTSEHQQDEGGEGIGDESPLGRRVRDESSSDGDAGDAKVARCSAGGIHSAMPGEESHESPRPGVWGGGARYLLEPVLATPLRKEQVRVDLSEAYSRKPHPDPEVILTLKK